MSLVRLSPTEVVQNRPFTDLRFTTQDLQAIRFMVVCVWLALENYIESADTTVPLVFHQPSPDHWTQRIVITQPTRLLTQSPLTVVGFFGIKNPDADVTLAQKLDRQLIPELSCFEELIAYATVSLPTGNFANLVLFASPEGKEHWGKSEKHAAAVRLLTPDYYASVRLYNGDLPDGISDPEALRLGLIKYYDYGDRPIWRAVRELNPGSVA